MIRCAAQGSELRVNNNHLQPWRSSTLAKQSVTWISWSFGSCCWKFLRRPWGGKIEINTCWFSKSLSTCQAFIWIVIMVFYHHWPEVPQACMGKTIKCSMTKLPCQGYSCIEFFCGDANVSRSMKYGMVACASLDILKGNAPMRTHQQNAFDLGTPAGLVFFVSILIELFSLGVKVTYPNSIFYV